MKIIQKRNIFTIAMVLSLLGSQQVSCQQEEKFLQDKIVNKLHSEILKGYDLNFPVEKPLTFPEPGFMSIFTLKTTEFPLLALNSGMKMKLLFDNFEPLVAPEYLASLDLESLTELELVAGKKRPENSLVTQLTAVKKENRLISGISSYIGRKRFSEMLTLPITDVSTLKNRQKVIRTFVEDANLFNNLKKQLQIIEANEDYYLDFCFKDGVTDEIKKKYFPWILSNNSTLAVTAENIVFSKRSMYSLIAALGLGAAFKAVSADTTKVTEPFATLLGPAYSEQHKWINNAVYAGIMSVVGGSITAMQTAAQTKLYYDFRNSMQKNIMHVAQYINAQRNILELCTSHSKLKNIIPGLNKVLDQVSGKSESVSSEFIRLNQLLQKSTFGAGDPSVFSSGGNIIVAYKHLCTPIIRKEFSSIFSLVGEIDSYVALAEKMNMHKKEENAPFCFVNFVENSDKPILEMKNFWNPFIDASKVVTNDISLNTGAERCMLITGPNTGGKSANMKAIVNNVITAGVFGVATASDVTMTPFQVITTYLNVSDDTGADKSLFQSEVNRAQEVLKSLKNLKPGQFGFGMIDEIFTGTAPDKAEQLAYDLMLTLSKLSNVIFVNATHFKPLTRLEQTTSGIVKNYKVDVKVSNGRVTQYLYKIVPGISQVSSAMQVFEEANVSFS